MLTIDWSRIPAERIEDGATLEIVLVWACDRTARSVRHFLEVLDQLDRLNIEFVSFRDNIDTGGPLGPCIVSSLVQ